MGELIILTEWKTKKDLAELDILFQELDEWIEYLGITNDFYIFDDDYNPIKLDVPDEIKNAIFNY
mgnify:CR=1 FL=1